MSQQIKIGACLLFVLLAGRGFAGSVAVGQKFPAMDAVAMPAIAGKVALVDFWASWCAPCKASFPVYTRLHADYAARGLAIVGVSVDDNAAAYAAFVRREAPPFPTFRDPDHRLAGRLDVPAMPTCYLLDRTGRIRFVHQGFHGSGTERAIRQEIETLLAEPPPAS